MKRSRARILISAFAFALLFSTSCTGFLGLVKKPPSRKPAEVEKRVEKRSTGQKKVDLKKRVEKMLGEGKYEEVVSLLDRGKTDFEKDEFLKGAYVRSLAGLREEAITDFSRGEYKSAGLLLVKIKGAVRGREELASEAGISVKEVEENIGECARKLMEEGLAQYREGNLGFAIKKWKEILLFLPNHAEAKKAIGVATVQLKNLRKLESSEK